MGWRRPAFRDLDPNLEAVTAGAGRGLVALSWVGLACLCRYVPHTRVRCRDAVLALPVIGLPGSESPDLWAGGLRSFHQGLRQARQSGLVERGLDPDRVRRWAIDGGKVLWRAIA